MNDKHTWKVLEIFGSIVDREILITSFVDDVLGYENKDDSSLVYFDNVSKKYLEDYIQSNSNIKKWQWSEIVEKNWMENCRDFFKPIIIKDKVYISTVWDEDEKNNMIDIKINPALAFGTGHHETTYMMIEAMLDFDFKEKSVLDIGTGSGILSILSKRLGSNRILAIDNDPLTENNFIENLKFNHIDDVEFKIADCTSFIDYNFDIILANINRSVIVDIIPNLTSSNTLVFLSGILNSDEDLISDLLNQYNRKIQKIYRKNKWSCIVIK